MRGPAILKNLAIIAAFVLISWFVLEMIGFEMALGVSLVLSVVLTLVLNLALGAFRRG